MICNHTLVDTSRWKRSTHGHRAESVVLPSHLSAYIPSMGDFSFEKAYTFVLPPMLCSYVKVVLNIIVQSRSRAQNPPSDGRPSPVQLGHSKSGPNGKYTRIQLFIKEQVVTCLAVIGLQGRRTVHTDEHHYRRSTGALTTYSVSTPRGTDTVVHSIHGYDASKRSECYAKVVEPNSVRTGPRE